MLAQIIDLTYPKVFEKYRSKYNYAWDNHHQGLLGLEVRKIRDDYFKSVKVKLQKLCKLSYFIESAGDSSRILLLGSSKNFREITEKCSEDKIIQNLLDKAINNFENYNSLSYEIKGKEFNFSSAYVMGILNVTPDSFSDGGKYLNPDIAAEHGIEMIDKGADIIDIGGESTRPGSESIPADEESKRILPVIQKILLERPTAIISVDTTKNIVASKALQHGAVIINDISGFANDIKLVEITKKFNASLAIMHMLGNPKNMQQNPEYENVVEEIYDFLEAQAEIAANSGINNIFIDPGIGFGKTVDHNLEIIQRLGDFKSLGYPILIGLSRKSFLGNILDLDVENRDVPTTIVETLSVKNGARIIRTHNVEYGVQICKLLSNLI
ncbi:MAG TPA: dihydropteroate synthase [Ignavibacteriaceae bacterium]